MLLKSRNDFYLKFSLAFWQYRVVDFFRYNYGYADVTEGGGGGGGEHHLSPFSSIFGPSSSI